MDKRGDIWAFGCVLYEMLTGQAAFQGEDVTEILAAVVKGGANLDLLPANLHPRVREAITRCLQKDPKRRYSSITEAQYEIEQALTDPSGLLVQPQALAERHSKWRLVLPWVAGAVVLSFIIGGLAVWELKPASPSEPGLVTRFSFFPPRSQILSSATSIAISPDGARIVYATTGGLYLRSMDQLDAKLIPGTEGEVGVPFFSHDGQWVGFFSEGEKQLKKIPIAGGSPVTLCEAQENYNTSWGAGNSIYYDDLQKRIMRVSANGGKPEPIIEWEGIYAPQMLPDGKNLLFTINEGKGLQVAVQSITSGVRKVLSLPIWTYYLRNCRRKRLANSRR